MQINHCLILAAGFGTRMGPIGQKLPKVLWPVYEKSLLELQVLYARELGIKNIAINIHYMKNEMLDYIESNKVFKDVTLLIEEPEILDIGGGIHNLARLPEVNYQGRLLVLNADQFFYMNPQEFFKRLAPFEKDPLILFNYLIDPKDGYNSLVCNTDREIIELKKNADILHLDRAETYTGISLIDLSVLDKIFGPSKFFESVCPFMKKKVKAVLLMDIDYWDFGTVSRFWKTSFLIMETVLKNPAHPFIEFLCRNEALDLDKVNPKLKSYYAESSEVINLSNDYLLVPLEKSILIHPQVDLAALPLESHIIWKDIVEVMPVE
ncbi:MAG: sugar phosphate nucleotidyltransferase [Bacteriovoracaceae bacterium]